MHYTIEKTSCSNFYTGKFLTDDILDLDWTDSTVNQEINIGPFTIALDLFIDPDNILNSYFAVKVSVNIPFVGKVVLLDGRIDKNNPKLAASIDDIASASIIFDVDKSILYAELVAFGYKYDIILWQFSELI